jgi:hypothetical protein
MIGRLVGALIGRKVKEKIVDAVMDKINLPDPIESAIKTAATGNVTDVIKVAAKAVGKKKA